jgi:hypothetical protein
MNKRTQNTILFTVAFAGVAIGGYLFFDKFLKPKSQKPTISPVKNQANKTQINSNIVDNSTYVQDSSGNVIALAPGSPVPNGYIKVGTSQSSGQSTVNSQFQDSSIYVQDSSGNMIAIPPGSIVPPGYTIVDTSSGSSGVQSQDKPVDTNPDKSNSDNWGSWLTMFV